MKNILLLLMIGLFFTVSIQAQTVAGKWKLTSLLVESDMVYSITEPITLNLDKNGKISGNGGCNSFQGTYKFKQPKKPFKKQKKIKFNEIISTYKNCPLVSDTEEAFFKSLRSAAKVVFKNEELVIKSKPIFVRTPNGRMLIQNTMTFARELPSQEENR
jgi:heat shock protein HslJ